MIYRAVQRVGARGRVHRLSRECAGERPAVVDRGVAANRLPPGRVSLSAPREMKPVCDKARGGGDRTGDSAGASE
eukprot:4852592-Pleurochrysis_carterae.AAC.1